MNTLSKAVMKRPACEGDDHRPGLTGVVALDMPGTG